MQVKALVLTAAVGFSLAGLFMGGLFAYRMPDSRQVCDILAARLDYRTRRLVVADKQQRVLCLLDYGQVAFHSPVSFGRGVGPKEIEGDLKTPEGYFVLSPARPSRRFGLFMPIGYPSAQHRRQAARLGKPPGGDVGVHGPHPLYAWSGVLQALVDHSEGCIVLHREAIEQLAAIVDAPLSIEILPASTLR